MAQAKRTTLKTSIMKIAKFSNSITEDTDSFDIQTHLDRLMDAWQKYEEQHMIILEGTGSEELAFQQIDYEDTETLVLTSHSNLMRQIQRRIRPIELSGNLQQNQSVSHHQNNSFDDHDDFSGLRVPRITIPEFTGEYLQWPSFRDLFMTMVGGNKKVPNVQKLSYLKKVVVGETTWEILKSRFENERIIVQELLNNIYQIPNATGSADDIKLILDTTNESLRELKNLGRPIEHYDDWLVFLIVKKLDKLSLEKWNEHVGDDKTVIEYEELDEFLNARFRILEGTKTNESKSELMSTKSSSAKVSNLSACHVSDSKKSDKIKCYYCNKNHRAKSCYTFQKKNPKERRQIVETANLCFNCLSPGHKLVECSSTRTCFKCGQRHHSMLHLDQKVNSPSKALTKEASSKALEATSSSSSASSHHVECKLDSNQDVVLATAIIVVILDSNKTVKLRALLDQGSQMSLISSFAAKRLRSTRIPYTGVPLTGAGGDEIPTNRGVVNFTFKSRVNDSTFQTEALVLDTVSQYKQSNSAVFIEASKKFPQIDLADPNFESTSPIDVLLAADVYAQVVLEGVNKFCGILVQNTSLGWILSGQYQRTSDLQSQLSINHSYLTIDKLLRSFWEIEEIPADSMSSLSVDELACEKHYQETHSRNSKGRYVVRLPFKLVAQQMELGYSKGVAVSSQIRMESRFKKNPTLKAKYTAFMSESLKLGHMELVKESEINKPSHECFYMPHHAVLRDSQTTALRVVFNASQKSSTGVSLNDKLHTGAKLQSDLFNVLTRFRKYKVCYMADIEKMYRRILVDRKDRDFQRIVWRENSNDELRTYRMRVVTDGTSSAPFLAIRTVQQLAADEISNYPLAYPTLMNDMFMDDMLSGSNDILSGIEHIRQINNIFLSAGMRMRKWTSNMADVLQEIPMDDRQGMPIEFGQGEYVKVLGIQWFPSTDCFGFKVTLPQAEETITKRQLLSHASKLFDPLGFLSPCTIIPKILMQRTWELDLKWNDPLPPAIKNRWVKFREELVELEKIRIPRFIGPVDSSDCTYEFHGFSDASKVGYSAEVFSRTEYPNGKIHVNLVAAKTKVAPVKKITIPCLELCGALLVSRLMKKVKDSLHDDNHSMYGWTDSEVVLGWLDSSPGIWQQFVGNRTAKILEILPYSQWNYVNSTSNPADCASRGILPSQLVSHSLWWNGPAWLSMDKSKWPSNNQPFKYTETTLMKKKTVMTVVTIDPRIEFLQRFSTLQKLLRMTAWCMRFIDNLRKRVSEKSLACHATTRAQAKNHQSQQQTRPMISRSVHVGLDSYLKVSELKSALELWIRNVQNINFSVELERMKSKRAIRKGKLRKLNPQIRRGKAKFLTKGYISVFICLSTRAIHLEAAEDYTTKEFIETFKRFTARRAKPTKMYSDNGSNFVGAATELTRSQKRAMREQLKEIASILANDSIEWEFNPPSGPHFGGIYEAGVKSMKYHLKRILGTAQLTFKELQTVLCQIECALNSRPLYALSDDIDDMNFLTPGHFLMGTSPSALPEESLLDINENRLTKWQRTQQMFQDFWKHWSVEYLSGLQNRPKWNSQEENLKVGELVILKEEDVPPTKWLMGRVLEVHPGSDGLVRVVTLRFGSNCSILTRPIHKLCKLPFLKPNELDLGF